MGISQQRWVYRLNGWYSLDDYAWSVVQGSDGNIYAAGVTDYQDGSGVLTVVSITTGGSLRWIWRPTLPPPLLSAGVTPSLTSDGRGEFRSLTWGPDGNLYAAGYAFRSGHYSDIIVVSLSPYGQHRWTYYYDLNYSYDASGVKSICCGSDTNIYVTGYGTWQDAPPITYLVILSLTNQGSFRWANSYGDNTTNNIGRSIKYGADGYVYVGGTLGGSAGSDMSIVKTTTGGTTQWTYTETGVGNGFDITRGSDGNIYLCGQYSNGNDMDYAVLSTTSSGARRWLYKYHPSGETSFDFASSIYFNGSTVSTAGNALGDMATIAVWSNGSEKFVHFYSVVFPQTDVAWSLAWGPENSGTTYAAGTGYPSSSTGYDLTVDCYNEIPKGLASDEEDKGMKERQGKGYSLFQNSPNPFVRTTEVTYSIAGAGYVSLKVFNSLGRLIKTLVDRVEGPGVHKATWDGTDESGKRVGTGIYFYSLVVGENTATRRLVLTR
jgi:hypothetical protein